MSDEADPEETERAAAGGPTTPDEEQGAQEDEKEETQGDEKEESQGEEHQETREDEPEEGTEPSGRSAATDEVPAPGEGVDWDMAAPEGAEDNLERWRRRLDERELGLDKRSEDLDDLEAELDEREQELDERRQELQEWERDLEQREEELDEFEAELEDREEELDEFEAELSERAREIGEHEETLHTYIDGQIEDLDGQVRETIRSTLASYDQNRTSGRFGTVGNLLIGIAGLALAAAGVGYGTWVTSVGGVGLAGAAATDTAIAAALLIVGLAVNLAAVAERI